MDILPNPLSPPPGVVNQSVLMHSTLVPMADSWGFMLGNGVQPPQHNATECQPRSPDKSGSKGVTKGNKFYEKSDGSKKKIQTAYINKIGLREVQSLWSINISGSTVKWHNKITYLIVLNDLPSKIYRAKARITKREILFSKICHLMEYDIWRPKKIIPNETEHYNPIIQS